MKNSDQKQQPHTTRREFLRGTVAAGAGATLLATLPGVAEAATEIVAAKPEEKTGYRLTPHIAAYYKTAAH